MNFVKELLTLLFITWLFVLTLQAPCNKKKINPKRALKRLRRKYYFVEKKFRSENEDNTGSDGNIVAFYCPFKRVIEDSSTSGINQIPKFTVKVVCPNCRDFCKPVYYRIIVLQKKGCDKRTGDERWMRVEKKIPVAYVYNPDY